MDREHAYLAAANRATAANSSFFTAVCSAFGHCFLVSCYMGDGAMYMHNLGTPFAHHSSAEKPGSSPPFMLILAPENL